MSHALDVLALDELDAVIALTHADITWHSPTCAARAWQAIDELLDRRNRLTQGVA